MADLKHYGLKCTRYMGIDTVRGKNRIEELTYMVELSKEKLNDQARKAAHNKSGQSRDGAVTITITEAIAEGKMRL